MSGAAARALRCRSAVAAVFVRLLALFVLLALSACADPEPARDEPGAERVPARAVPSAAGDSLSVEGRAAESPRGEPALRRSPADSVPRVQLTDVAAPALGGWTLDASRARDPAALLALADSLEELDLDVSLRLIEIDVADGRRRTRARDETAESRGEHRMAPAELAGTLAGRGFRVALVVRPFGADERDLAAEERAVGAASPTAESDSGSPAAPSRERIASVALLDHRGRPVARAALGDIVLDPLRPEGRRAIRDRVARAIELCGGAVHVVRVAGIAAAYDAYGRHAAQLGGGLEQPALGRAALAARARAALAAALEAVREGAGPHRSVAGDSGTPADAADRLDFWRPSIAPLLGGEHEHIEARVTIEQLPRHGFGVRLEGQPFDLGRQPALEAVDDTEAVRSALSLLALTGRAPFFVGRPDERVRAVLDLVARVVPPRACTPLEGAVARAAGGEPPAVWVAVMDHDGGLRDVVVALFNHDPFASRTLAIDADAVLPRAAQPARWVVFDRWSERFLGAVGTEDSIELLVPPRGCRVLSLHEARGAPMLVGTSRRLLGRGDVGDVAWHAADGELQLTVRGAQGSPRLHVWVPPSLRVATCRARGGRAGASATGEHVTVDVDAEVDGAGGGDVAVTLVLAPATAPTHGAASPVELRSSFDVATGATLLEWTAPPLAAPSAHAGWEVLRDGRVVGRTLGSAWSIDAASANESHVSDAGAAGLVRLAVRPAGNADAARSILADTRAPPLDVELVQLAPRAVEAALPPGRDRGATGLPARVAGEPAASGVGVTVPSTLEYELGGRFTHFTARVGIETASDLGVRASFRVLVDGVERWSSGLVRHGDPPTTVDVALAGARRLSLVAALAPEVRVRPGQALAMWGDGRLTASR